MLHVDTDVFIRYRTNKAGLIDQSELIIYYHGIPMSTCHEVFIAKSSFESITRYRDDTIVHRFIVIVALLHHHHHHRIFASSQYLFILKPPLDRIVASTHNRDFIKFRITFKLVFLLIMYQISEVNILM